MQENESKVSMNTVLCFYYTEIEGLITYVTHLMQLKKYDYEK